MTVDEPDDLPAKQYDDSRRSGWRALLLAYRWPFAALAVAIAALVVTQTNGSVTIPRIVKLNLFVLTLASVIGYLPAQRVVDYLWTPDRIYLLEVRISDEHLALWSLSPTQFEEMEVREGALKQWPATVPIYEVLRYIPDENVAVCTWRGSKSELELLENEKAIDEIRGDLEDMARRGLSLRVQLPSIVRSAVMEVSNFMTKTYEQNTMPDGSQIDRAVESAMPDDLEDKRSEFEKEVDENMVEDTDDLDETAETQEQTDPAERVVADGGGTDG